MFFSIIFFGGIIFLASLPSGVSGEALNPTDFDRCVPRTDGLVCYSTVDTQDPWIVGESVCHARNMTMLEILTETENKAVFDLLTKKNMVDSWLAAVQSTESWRWLDGVEIGDQGCFVDNETNPDIEYAEDFPTNNSVTNCIAYCSSLLYSYAAVEAGYRCRCGDAFGKYGQDDANCGIQCPGNLSESCGGNRPTSQQIYAVNGATANWLGGQPNNNNGYQSCATLDSSNEYKWQDVYCKDGNRAICEIPRVNGLCANSRASVVNGRCLMLTDQLASYFESRYNCRSLGGDLVMHLTAADTQEIARWLNLPHGGPSTQFYIGLVKWQWKWATGSEFLYTDWKQDQPTGPHFDCVTVKPNANNGEWTAASCSTPHLYICQQSNATVKVTAPLFTLAPTTTPRRTAPPPLPTTIRAPSYPSTLTQGQQQPSHIPPSSSNSTVNAAIIGGAVAGGVVLLILICVVVIAFACCGATCCCCSRRGEDAKKKGVESGAEAATAPPPPSYFFGIETTPKYRNGDKSSSHPAIPDFDTLKSDSSTFDGNRKSPNPDVVPRSAHGSYPMATPYEDVTETRTTPDPYLSDIYVKPELSY